MTARTMSDVREYVFRSLDRLEKATGDNLEDEILRAKSVSDGVSAIVATLKAETAFAKETGAIVVSDLIETQPKPKELSAGTGPRPVLPVKSGG